MALDHPQTAVAAAARHPSEPCDKVRIRFRKEGDLRFLSHHDLMHCFERLLRRADIPFRLSAGFHPKPRMAFALSLAVGIVGLEEVVEVELAQPLPPQEVQARLAAQAPPGLHILSVRGLERRTTARVRRVCYRLPLPPERQAGLPERLAAVLAQPHCWVERPTTPRSASAAGAPPRRRDIRPFLRDLRLVDGQLEMDFWVTPAGTARPEEVLALLGLDDLLDTGAVLVRTRLELADEAPAEETGPPQPPTPAPRSAPPAAAQDRPTPLLPGPLSFDS